MGGEQSKDGNALAEDSKIEPKDNPNDSVASNKSGTSTTKRVKFQEDDEVIGATSTADLKNNILCLNKKKDKRMGVTLDKDPNNYTDDQLLNIATKFHEKLIVEKNTKEMSKQFVTEQDSLEFVFDVIGNFSDKSHINAAIKLFFA